VINKKVESTEVQSVISRMVKAGNLKFDEKDVPVYLL
jgi:hypothetical protein